MKITVCMGSSCFARGNAENLDFLEKYIKDNNINAEIELIGSRCENQCEKGPNIIINNKEYNNVSIKRLEEILENE